MLKTLSIDALAPGMMVTKVIEQNGPVKIRRVGMIRSDAMIKGLREMGVQQLEVDQSQSIDVESAQATKVDATPIKLTATQRLMAKDKQTSNVDRELSQQFHRSLFMPAIDDMPSKWRLYFQPYAVLFALVLVGLASGFSVMQAPKWLAATSASADHQLAGDNKALPTSPDNATLGSQVNDDPIQNQEANLAQTPNSTTDAEPSQGEAEQVRDITVSNGQMSVDGQVQANGESVSNDSARNSARNNTVNGIELEEGQTILGYGAQVPTEQALSEIDEEQGVELTVEQDIESEMLSPDLLRRVNQAAAALEAEQDLIDNDGQDLLDSVRAAQAQVAPVTDNQIVADEPAQTQVKRIDQLPASILTQMPSMSFSAHMYVSNPQERWVRVNGRRLMEGDLITDELSIVEIEPDRILLAFKGETFSMNALSDW